MDYEIVKLKEIADFNKEFIGKEFGYDFINYLDTANITNGTIDTIVKMKINESPSRAKRIVHKNDIVYSTVRPNLCHYGILDAPVDNMIVSTGFAVISCKDNVNPYYVYNYLTQNDITSQLHSIAENSTSAYPSIKPSDLENIEIMLPKLEIQNKIAKVLTDINEKIKLNNEINNNLYDEMQFLYNDWFKEFNPFKNNQFKDTVLGKIPEKFNIEDIYSISSVIYGAPFKSNLFNEEKNGKPIIRIRDLKNQNIKTYTPENHPKGYLLQKGDITVGMDGEFRPYFWGNDEAWLNQRVCVFINKRRKGKAFLYYSLKPLLNFIEKTEVATTVIHIGKNDFDEFKIILPDEDTLDKFDEITNPMVWQIVQNMVQNHRLEKLRDTLLPKLMNGEINLDNIEI